MSEFLVVSGFFVVLMFGASGVARAFFVSRRLRKAKMDAKRMDWKECAKPYGSDKYIWPHAGRRRVMSRLLITHRTSQTADQDGFERDCAAWVTTAKTARPYHGNQELWRVGLSAYILQQLAFQQRARPMCFVEPCGIDQERITVSAMGLEPVDIPLDMSGPEASS